MSGLRVSGGADGCRDNQGGVVHAPDADDTKLLVQQTANTIRAVGIESDQLPGPLR